MRPMMALLVLAALAGPLSAQITKAVARPVPSGCRCGPTCECPVCDGSCGRPLNERADVVKTQIGLICFPYRPWPRGDVGDTWGGGFDQDDINLRLRLGRF